MNPTSVVIVALFLRLAVGQSSSSVDYCQALEDVISICEIQTPSFTALPASEQAGCVCGSTLGTIPWGPASFDGLASSCAIAYASVNPTIAYDASELSGMCTSFAVQGQSVLASSTPTPTSYIAGTIPQVTEFSSGYSVYLQSLIDVTSRSAAILRHRIPVDSSTSAQALLPLLLFLWSRPSTVRPQMQQPGCNDKAKE